MFSCEFCEISKNIFFTEHLRTTAFAFQAAYTMKIYFTDTFKGFYTSTSSTTLEVFI